MAALTPSCHEAHEQRTAPAGAPVIAFIGAPNVGKSTLFNRLTGAGRQMGNWPGTSVETGRGTWSLSDRELDAIDFPGAYSLDPTSPDEAFTRELILEVPSAQRPDALVVVAGASSLARSLYLLAQVRELPYRVVVALTMNDLAAQRGQAVDTEILSEHLDCPVVAVDPRRGTGIAELTRTVAETLASPVPAARRDGPAGPDDFSAADERFAWLQQALDQAVTTPGRRHVSRSERIDSLLLHPLLGPVIFLAVMWAVFQLTTTVAAPLQDGLDALFQGPLAAAALAGLTAVGLDHPLITGLVINGLIGGVGTVLTFIPLMAIMFALLALLEDSGYMARAAVVTDRVMRLIGLPGKAFLPLIVGFGCNVPAISATRVLGDARQRLMTVLLIPFTSCSARLTVYVMLAQTFFPGSAGTVVFAMYVISILLIVLAGLALKHTLWRTMGQGALVMDLPTYQLPTPRLVAQVTWMRLKGFLHTAGGIIVVVVAVIWLLQALPAPGATDPGPIGAIAPEDSLYAALSGLLAPLFTPAGFGAWPLVGALVTGFLAKEAVIASWAQTYQVADPSAQSATAQGTSDLATQLQLSFAEASGGHPVLAVAAFMVFLLAYTPCVATLGAQLREVGWRWTLAGLIGQLLLAWLLAVAVFQGGLLVTGLIGA
ncbi:ferrous iron transport protein B [Brachybacterium sp. Marseille-Q7125]|uniref:ferrous iron transport protein B n=1 Tax=Brachybacterium sp. Marseille-Q7125 TaxID=2932815 RepID=UPI001FF258CE|nr:ferrous iron transport protein B [Brachybacterium sp. Marseille-Q7125]